MIKKNTITVLKNYPFCFYPNLCLFLTAKASQFQIPLILFPYKENTHRDCGGYFLGGDWGICRLLRHFVPCILSGFRYRSPLRSQDRLAFLATPKPLLQLRCPSLATNSPLDCLFNAATLSGDGVDRCQWQMKGDGGRESYEQTRGASARRSMRR